MKKYIIFLIIILFSPYFFIEFSNDSYVFVYMSSLFFEGKFPYLDAWDHKGVFIYFINYLGLIIGGKSIVGIRILEILLILFSFLELYKTLLINYSIKKSFIAICFGIFSLLYFFDAGNLTEEYGVIFVLLALSRLLKKEHNKYDFILIGILFILTFNIRANLISFWVATFLLFLFIIYGLKKQKKL